MLQVIKENYRTFGITSGSQNNDNYVNGYKFSRNGGELKAAQACNMTHARRINSNIVTYIHTYEAKSNRFQLIPLLITQNGSIQLYNSKEDKNKSSYFINDETLIVYYDNGMLPML